MKKGVEGFQMTRGAFQGVDETWSQNSVEPPPLPDTTHNQPYSYGTRPSPYAIQPPGPQGFPGQYQYQGINPGYPQGANLNQAVNQAPQHNGYFQQNATSYAQNQTYQVNGYGQPVQNYPTQQVWQPQGSASPPAPTNGQLPNGSYGASSPPAPAHEQLPNNYGTPVQQNYTQPTNQGAWCGTCYGRRWSTSWDAK